MASGAVGTEGNLAAGDMLIAGVLRDGSAGHPYIRSSELLGTAGATRNLADAIHYLCMLHGRLPGVVDLAADRSQLDLARGWLDAAIAGFAIERVFLTRLVVAAGPLPSTAGQAECEAAVLGQRHALEMLARSDRDGCALGAAIGLVLDWHQIRIVLDLAAERFGVDRPKLLLPEEPATRILTTTAAETPSVLRAINFGMQQLVIQHRGLWDLLEAREQARRLS